MPSIFANNTDDVLARATVETWVIKGEKGAGDCCKKCDGKVYEAEKMTTASVSMLIGYNLNLSERVNNRLQSPFFVQCL